MEILTFSHPIFWIIAIPLLSAPLIYLSGRLGKLGQVNYGFGNAFVGVAALPQPAVPTWSDGLPRVLSFVALAATWIPVSLSIRLLAQDGPFIGLVQSIAMRMDGISLLMSVVVLSLGTLVALFSADYMHRENGEEKFYAMLVTLVGVMCGLVFAYDLFNLWVWFEAMAVSSYLLVVFYREQPASLEAGFKYVFQSAAGSILVLLGIAIVLAQTGTLRLDEIQAEVAYSPVLMGAAALFIIGFGVKAALVPMHTWLPDAHTQAPSGISAMLSGVVIEVGLVAMLRAAAPLAGLHQAGIPGNSWGPLLMVIGCLNMLVGNLMALRQTQIKRLLAYSSLSHMGYIVLGVGIAVFANQQAAAQGSLFHILNHAFMKGLAFLAAGALLYVLTHLSRGPESDHGPLTTADIQGAAQRYPLIALTFSLAVLGLGGLPPLSGFMSKWQIFTAGFATQNYWVIGLVIFAALNSVLSLAYYAPLVNAMYRKQPSQIVLGGGKLPATMVVPLVVMGALVVALGFWPGLVEWLTAPAGQALLDAFGGAAFGGAAFGGAAFGGAAFGGAAFVGAAFVGAAFGGAALGGF